MTLHVASLFSGIGLIDLGFHRAAIPTRLLCEADPAARSVLARRFPDTPIHDDIRELTADDYPLIAATLTAGTASPGVSAPGRHNEGDVNIVPLDEVDVRRLTPLECERLQGAPDGWTAGQSDSARYRQLGNAVAVPVFAWVATRIARVDSAIRRGVAA